MSISEFQLRNMARHEPNRFQELIKRDVNVYNLAVQIGLIEKSFGGQVRATFSTMVSKIGDWGRKNPEIRNLLLDVGGAGLGGLLSWVYYKRTGSDEQLYAHSLQPIDKFFMKPSTGIPMASMTGYLASKLIRQGMGASDPELKEQGMHASNIIDDWIFKENSDWGSISATLGTMGLFGLEKSVSRPETMLDENLEGRWGRGLKRMGEKLKEKGLIDPNIKFFAFNRGLDDFPLIRQIREDHILLTKDVSQFNLEHKNSQPDQIWNRLYQGNRPIRIVGMKEIKNTEHDETILRQLYGFRRFGTILRELYLDIFYFLCRYSEILSKSYSRFSIKPKKFFLIGKPAIENRVYKIKLSQYSNHQFQPDDPDEILVKNSPWTIENIPLKQVHEERIKTLNE